MDHRRSSGARVRSGVDCCRLSVCETVSIFFRVDVISHELIKHTCTNVLMLTMANSILYTLVYAFM